ncbi:hypothetical protein [Sediminitomix flava]|uniref:Uncharacterized protein n=1 Tax=Sediminitomix flava TaxID=379075 RepID=A0A315ZDX1_SEDFL|nr:hypothetical protein [Sediminitomix flava]PWJ43329.1 hypothetical protein BC781_102886 [Sediminitomix flava]
MFWTLLFSFFLLGNGFEHQLIHPKTKGILKKYITEEQRLDEIMAIVNYHNKTDKRIQKKEEKLAITLENLFLDKGSSREQLWDVYEDYISVRDQRADLAISQGIKIRELISSEEWDKMLVELQHEFKKTRYRQTDYLKELQKSVEDMSSQIKRIIGDEQEQKKLENIVLDFQEQASILAEEYAPINIEDNKVLSDKYATAKEFNQLKEKINQLDRQSFGAYVKLHHELSNTLTELQWEALLWQGMDD